ncbi:hypothetical protein DPMN_069887 [Dreissena polymorpha]|uniref:Uncharacterized protein n=1 Tax=Dreissena polymorpha TaxID=45954 RepID=A0A9D3Z206_DREPO|nr:hypothetical protein DPMN_069887 [Dreissena polymorpha]
MHEKAAKQPGLGLLNTLNRLQQVCKKSPLQSLSDTAHLLALLKLLDQMTSLDMTRFQAKKKKVAPGVEVTHRCLLGPNTGPASFRDCNRYTEATIISLLSVFPKNKQQVSMVSKAYENIRNLIHGNARVA